MGLTDIATVYPSDSMRLRAWAATLLVALVAALPTILSLCELHCLTPDRAAAAASEATRPSCAGHDTDRAGNAPASPMSEHDCGGHSVLAIGARVGSGLQYAPISDSLPVTIGEGSLLERLAGLNKPFFASTDLSPPFDRRSGVLRL